MKHTWLIYSASFLCEALYTIHIDNGEMKETVSDETHVTHMQCESCVFHRCTYTAPTPHIETYRNVSVWGAVRKSHTCDSESVTHVQCHVFMSQWLIQSASFFHVKHMNEAPFVSHTPVTLSHWLIYSATFVWDSDSYTAPESVTHTQRLCFHVRHMNEALYVSLCVSDSYTAHRFFLSSWLMYSAWISDSLCSCFQPCPPPSKKICNKKIKWESAWKR